MALVERHRLRRRDVKDHFDKLRIAMNDPHIDVFKSQRTVLREAIEYINKLNETSKSGESSSSCHQSSELLNTDHDSNDLMFQVKDLLTRNPTTNDFFYKSLEFFNQQANHP